MMTSSPGKKNLSVALFLAAAAFFVVLKYCAPPVIEALYRQRQLAPLNFLAFSGGQQPMEFYLGRIEDFWTGPLAIIFSAAALLALSRFLVDVPPRKFFLSIFVFLIVTKFEVLFYPPYGELAAGPFAEAVWLLHNHFNYAALAAQPSFTEGGPKVYLSSVYPTFLALLMNVTRSPQIFLVVLHLVVFAMTAGIAVLFREILQKIFDRRTAFLGVVLLLSLPVAHSMTEMFNMETMCLFFVMIAAYYLVNRRIAAASIFSVLAVLVKGTAGFIGAAVFVIGIVLFFTEKGKERWRFLFWGALPLIFGVVNLLVLRIFVSPTQAPAGTISPFIGIRPLWESSWMLVLLYAASVLIFLAKNVQRNFFKEHYTAIVLFIIAGAWFALFLNVSVMGYRYQWLLMPFLVAGVLIAAAGFRRWPVVSGLTVAAIFIASLGSYGLFFKKGIPSSEYSYHKFERSLEYRNDLRMHVRLARAIESRFSGWTVGAPFVVAQKLAMPELGYVKKPLPVVIYGMRCTYGGITNFDGLKNLNLRRTVWVGFLTNHIIAGVDYPVAPEDKVLEEVVYGDKKVKLFLGGIGIERMRMIVEMSRRGLLPRK